MWSSRYVRVYGQWLFRSISSYADSHTIILTHKYELVILAVKVVEVIPPQIFGIACIDETMAIWRSLDEHMWW
jgi:hypothetical protein